MSDENFLNRWARRKQEVAKAEAKQAAAEPAPHVGEKKPDAATSRLEDESATAVDLTKLPNLDEISAETDITGFLKPGVPSDLARAALRRAWAEDPAVRDFVGLQENDWVFNKPGPAQGFGPLGPEHDVAKMLTQIFGETSDGEKEAPSEPVTAPTPKSESASAEPEQRPADTTSPVAAQEESDAAAHNQNADRPRRTHGGALPTSISKT